MLAFTVGPGFVQVSESQFGRKVWLLYHYCLQLCELESFQLKSSPTEALRKFQVFVLVLHGARVAIEGNFPVVFLFLCPSERCPHAHRSLPLSSTTLTKYALYPVDHLLQIDLLLPILLNSILK